jgi:predicted ester cyclase
MSDKMLDPVRRHIDGANRHDAGAFAAPYAANATNHGRPVGREGLRIVGQSLLTTFPDIHFDIETSVVQGDTVMCEMTMTGTHLGEPQLRVLGGHLVGVPPTGRRVRQRQMHLFRIAAGEITEHRAVRDDLGLMEQLGLIQSTASPGEDISRLTTST